MPNTCHIVAAGDFAPHLLQIKEGDFVIAADGGYSHLTNCPVTPHLFIGDGDSLGFLPQGIPTVVLPKEKDDTDMLAAIREGLTRGFRHFALYGALGGERFSHSLANVQALAFLASHGAEGEIIDENSRISLLTEGSHKLDCEDGYVSLFAFGGKAVVSIENAAYPLQHHTLSPDFPIGTSNRGQRDTSITVHSGAVLLVSEASSL